MQRCKKIAPVLFLLCVLLLPNVARAQERTFLLEGVYSGSEVGDFNHLLLMSGGQMYSFFCSNMITDILDKVQTKLPIVVEFYTDRQYFEGAGQEIDMQIVKSVFIADEYAPSMGIRIYESQRP